MLREAQPPSDRGCELLDGGHWPRQQGHLDARRQLAQAIGWTVPSEPGDRTRHPTRDVVVSTTEV